jgi:tubby-related protein 1
MTNKSQQRLVANARYENNCCQPSGPRRMSADVINATNKAASDTMSGSGVSALAAETNVTELVNKKPRYDEARKAYVMKFNHRVKRSSVKNFILVKKDESDKVPMVVIQDILLFGKCNKQMFNLDISHPLSPMQAFAIALTSFDSKLVSE